MRLLITRPEEDGGKLAEQLAARGHEPVLLPLLEIHFAELPPLPLAGLQALIATSRNALRALRRNAAFAEARALPVYCVGTATAGYAAELGFADVRIGAGTGRDLAVLIPATARVEAGALLHLTGEHIAFDLAEALSRHGFDVRRAVLYTARENAAAGPALAGLLAAGLDGAILMSPRTAQVFAGLIEGVPPAHIRGLTCYCYSQAVAKPLETVPGLRLSVAAHPNEADLLAIIGDAAISRAMSNHSDELLGKS